LLAADGPVTITSTLEPSLSSHELSVRGAREHSTFGGSRGPGDGLASTAHLEAGGLGEWERAPGA